MIKVNELRIGNFILSSSGRPDVISEISSQRITFGNENSKSIEPIEELSFIPLSEEWLLKFGFKKGYEKEDFIPYDKDGFDGLKDFGSQSIMLYKGEFELGKNHLHCGYYDNQISPIDFVHQLQNLYFALTGVELTTK